MRSGKCSREDQRAADRRDRRDHADRKLGHFERYANFAENGTDFGRGKVGKFASQPVEETRDGNIRHVQDVRSEREAPCRSLPD